jgi:hypothetical protein
LKRAGTEQDLAIRSKESRLASVSDEDARRTTIRKLNALSHGAGQHGQVATRA